MKLPVVIHRARLGPDEFRVIRPAQPLIRAVLSDRDRYLDAYLDQDTAQRVAGLWMLAARSPRSLIHLPMRTNRPPAREVPDDVQLDLVLLHHSLQFAPARWKQLRGRLGRGRPQTVSLPEAEHADDAVVDYAARHYVAPDNRRRPFLHRCLVGRCCVGLLTSLFWVVLVAWVGWRLTALFGLGRCGWWGGDWLWSGFCTAFIHG